MKTVVKSILTPMGLASLSVGLFAQTYNISTVTGSYNLDSNSTASPLNAPQAVAVDSAGVVYFTDTLGNRVRKYDPVTTKVTTIAGDGTIGSAAGATVGGVAQTAGAGGPAVKAKLWQPKGVALDSNGNIFIADSFNHTIEKVDSAGVLTNVAGLFGGGAFTGDGRAAISAYMRNPHRIKVDSQGAIYIAEKENNRIRKVGVDGIIRTVAGSGGNNTTTGGGFSGDGGPAVLAKLGQPEDVAIDQWGNMYIADTANNRIRLVSKTDAFGTPLRDSKGNLLTDSTAIITTVAGGGVGCGSSGGVCTGNDQPLSATLSGPRGIVLDSNNNVYIADSGNNRIFYLNFNNNAGCGTNLNCVLSNPTLVAVNVGAAISGINTVAPLTTPVGLALSGTNLYIAEEGGNRIRLVDLTSANSTILVQGGVNPLAGPRGLAVDAAGSIWVSDTASNRIGKLSQTDGTFTKVAGTCPPRSNTGTLCPATGALAGFPTTGGDIVGFLGLTAPVLAANSQVSAPWGGAFDANGNYLFADRGNNRIRMITPQGAITTIAGGANSPNPLVTSKLPTASTAAGYYGDGLPATQGLLRSPSSVAVDSLGQIYIADTGNNVIRKIDTAGIMSTFAGTAPACATIPNFSQTTTTTTVVSGTGSANATTTSATTTTTCTATALGAGDGLLATEAFLNQPVGVAADKAGNVYIADTNNQAVRIVTPDGIIQTIVGLLTSEGKGGDGIPGSISSLSHPMSVAVDGNGLVFIAEGVNTLDSWGVGRNSRIRVWNPTTTLVTTITSGINAAGLGAGTYAGDGGAASKSLALLPTFLTVDGQNNVYFTDLTNRVRKLTPVKAQ